LTKVAAIHTVSGTSETMNPTCTPRRDFLLQLAGAAGAALISAQWPAMAAAGQHAQEAKSSPQPHKFEVLTPEQAQDVEAIAARIIPTDELPGAAEAGVVYFIDYALRTFAKEARPSYETGLKQINDLTAKRFPGVVKFSAATHEQQDNILEMIVGPSEPGNSRHRQPVITDDFAKTIWFHVVAGFLVAPEGGGNRDYAGWKVIGRDPAHTFASPFGFYDKDYPGWQPAAGETEKK